MKPWVEDDASRLRPQEAALLALCDRMTVLEQAFTAETDALRKLTLEQARRLAAQHDELQAAKLAIEKLSTRLARVQRDHQSLLDILGRET